VPANLTMEFGKKYEEYKNATSPALKARLLKELIALAPKHKGTERLLGQLKKSLSRLEDRMEAERKAKKAGGHHGIRKVAPMLVLVGPPNSGKTTLFRALTGKGDPQPYPNSTQQPVTAIAHYKHAKLQMVDTPSFDSSYGHNGDVVIICGPDHSLARQFRKPHIIFADNKNPEVILEEAWHSLKLMRIFTPDGKYPMLAKIGSTVGEVANKIHKNFVNNFEWAKVQRGGRITRIGLDFILEDGDMLYLKSRV